MYKTIIFDLDGTIIDSSAGVTHAVQYGLAKMGIPVDNADTLRHFIGPPLYDTFEQCYGFNTAQQEQVVSYYREYYEDKGVHENFLYDGIIEVLHTLKANDKYVALATSKPEKYANIILDELAISRYFDLVAGASLDKSMREKIQVLGSCIQRSNRDKSEMIMVGDRYFDVEGAKFYEMDSVGVLYGFGDLAEMENCKPTHIVKTPKDILEIVL